MGVAVGYRKQGAAATLASALASPAMWEAVGEFVMGWWMLEMVTGSRVFACEPRR